MAEIIRLKSWKTYLSDGRSSVTYGSGSRNTVAVAVILGFEPVKLTEGTRLNVDDIVLEMAEHIRKARTKRKKERQ